MSIAKASWNYMYNRLWKLTTAWHCLESFDRQMQPKRPVYHDKDRSDLVSYHPHIPETDRDVYSYHCQKQTEMYTVTIARNRQRCVQLQWK